jgi:hypothetical protein
MLMHVMHALMKSAVFVEMMPGPATCVRFIVSSKAELGPVAIALLLHSTAQLTVVNV